MTRVSHIVIAFDDVEYTTEKQAEKFINLQVAKRFLVVISMLKHINTFGIPWCQMWRFYLEEFYKPVE